MRQFSSHRHLHIVIRKRRQHDSHIPIHTTDDIIHIDSLVDTHQEGLKAAVALHHRQELLALYVHEDTRQGISRHRLDVAAFNRTIGLSRLLQGLIYFFIKGEGFSLHLQDTVFHAHLSSNHYLRRVGILRRAKGKWSYELLRQRLSLSHHSHRRSDGFQSLEHRRCGNTFVLISLQIFHHLLLELGLRIGYNRSHNEECLIRKADQPRIFQYREMKAFALLHLCSDMLFAKRSKPVFNIALIAHLGTKSEVAISTLKEEYLL